MLPVIHEAANECKAAVQQLYGGDLAGLIVYQEIRTDGVMV